MNIRAVSRHAGPRSRALLFAAALLALMAGCQWAPAPIAVYRPATTPPRQPTGPLETAARDSVVVLVYGDNRPGHRVMTARYGIPIIAGALESRDPAFIGLAVLNVPIALVQLFLPALDGFQDLYSIWYSHRFRGGNQQGVLRALERGDDAALIVSTGDLVQDGRRGGQWQDFDDAHRALRRRVPYLAAVGNHERMWHPAARANWDAVMGPPPRPERYWYALDLGGDLARFVVLDSNVLADPGDHFPDDVEDSLAIEQLAWADSALTRDAHYKFLVIHHPLASSGHHFSDWTADDSNPVENNRRARLLAMCREHRVTAVLAGHEHLYQRVYITSREGRQGFWQLTTGGGGSPLYRISEKDRLRAITQKLPDGSHVTYPGPEHSVYHYCRMILRLRPKPGEMSAELRAYRVNQRGEEQLLDQFDLSVEIPGPPAIAAKERS
jgi:hypothetical protein